MDEILILVKNAKSGDELAFAELLDKYQKLILRMSNEFSNKCPEPQRDCEDFLQEAKIAFYNAVTTYDETKERTFGAYAKICIKYRLISCVRKLNSKKRIKTVEREEQGQDIVSAITISKEQRKYIFSVARENLSRFEYVVFELYFSGLRAMEISKRLGKREKSVNNAIYRARTKLSRLVDNDT